MEKECELIFKDGKWRLIKDKVTLCAFDKDHKTWAIELAKKNNLEIKK